MATADRPDQPFDVRVGAIGARGDGIADTPGGPVYLPYTVPGDVVRVRIGPKRRGHAVERLEDGPDRRTPECAHFGVCGGCALQHVQDALYADWKRTLVVEALGRNGLVPDVAPLVRARPGDRRRIRLAGIQRASGPLVGFRERGSQRIVDIGECPVAAPKIAALIGPLRGLLPSLPGAGRLVEIVVTRTDHGLDVFIRAHRELDLPVRERLVRFAEGNDLARISWAPGAEDPEPVVARKPVRFMAGDVAIDLPADAFIQPTAVGEAALRADVMGALAGARRVADLFSGCGAFALPLASAGASVLAVDGYTPAVNALAASARGGGFGERVTVAARDLDQRPVSGAELKPLDGVVLDPPRAGAPPQTAALADSRVPVIAYASCNPATFARDARVLIDGGYRLDRVTPVDQFLWSPHLELVGIFRR